MDDEPRESYEPDEPLQSVDSLQSIQQLNLWPMEQRVNTRWGLIDAWLRERETKRARGIDYFYPDLLGGIPSELVQRIYGRPEQQQL